MKKKHHSFGCCFLRCADFDYFNDVKNKDGSHGGQRIATMLIYLSTPEEGGETVFPNADKKVSGPGWSDCARRGFALHPQKGDAILFFSLKPDGSEVRPEFEAVDCGRLVGWLLGEKRENHRHALRCALRRRKRMARNILHD